MSHHDPMLVEMYDAIKRMEKDIQEIKRKVGCM
jgi:hypothetical protein